MTTPRRVEELLALGAVEGLDDAQASELQALLAKAPDVDPDAFAYAAAALDLALAGDEEPLPETLKTRILAAARHVGPAASPAHTGAAVGPLEERTSRRDATTPWFPWLLAAAAALVAVVGWWPRTVGEPADAVPFSTAAIESASDVLVRPWSATEDSAAAGAAGEVVWSTARQSGFMRIRGLAANDPAVEQYQLWIFDRRQDERYPIDGGVFDVPPEAGEVLVPIDAKIAIADPYLFAITVEKPGGVVVSSRERIPLLAEV